MNVARIICVIISTLTAAAVPLSASMISGLYDTGVDGSGVALPDGISPDPHYTIVSGSDGSVASAATIKTSASGYPVGDWNADSTTSAWIMPGVGYPDQFSGPSNFTLAGYYDYLTTFILPIDVSSIAISAGIAVDNELTGILVNGVSVGSFATGTSLANLEDGSFPAFDQFNPISFTSDNVLAGTNTLVFQVHNDAGNTGLRVYGIAGTFTVAVPEPATIGLFAFALLLFRR